MSGARTVIRRMLPLRFRRWLTDRRAVRWVRIRSRNSFVIAPALRRQLAWRGAPRSAPYNGQRILVPLVETTHYQFYQTLALAKALSLRGAAVRVLVCDAALDGCEVKNSRRRDPDQCLSCRLNQRGLLHFFGLDVVPLSTLVTDAQRRRLREEAERIARDYPERLEYKGVELVRMTNDSVTRFYYGAVPVEGSPELVRQRARHLYSAFVGVEAAERLDRDWHPTSVLGQMGVYVDWAPYAHYFRRQGVRYNLLTMAAYDLLHAVTLNYWDFYTGTARFERWRAARATKFLTAEEQRALECLLSERFSIGGPWERGWGWFDRNGPANLTVDRSKRNVFLFSNLSWDVGINYEGTLYDDVTKWVLDTVAMLAERDDCHLYIKTHPEELYGSAKTAHGVADAIRVGFPVLPSNVTVIPPELKIKPYALFPHVDLGVVYNSTIGLEMLVSGIPVVTVGAAPYGGHGFALEPRTRAEYEDALLGRISRPRPDQGMVELFAYFYLIKSQIPWRLTRKVYFDDFRGFTFDSLDALLPGNDKYLDHLCECILAPERAIVEDWE